MAGYKLSHTAEEIDELLSKIQMGAVLPVVELSTVVPMTGNVISLTEYESALLDETYQNKCSIICNFTFESGLIVSTPLIWVGSVAFGYSGVSVIGSLEITKGNDGWTVCFVAG